jgi:hypothetical protein
MPAPHRACRLYCAICSVLVAGTSVIWPAAREARADDPEDDAVKQEAQNRKDRYTNWMRMYAEGTKIKLLGKEDKEPQIAELVPNPVFRYSDEERAIPDATLWVWTRNARPVAFQKVEGNNHGGGRQWTICFASLSEGLLDVGWEESRRRYSTRTPGVTFKPVPRAESPAATSRARIAQLKALKNRFTGRLNVNDDGSGGAETRTIAKPIFEYVDPESKLPLGAIFGMTSTGTNPDLLLLVEVRSDGEGQERWDYAHARMTSSSVRVRLDDTEIWSEGFAPLDNPAFDNWTFYFLRREFK